MLGHIHLLGCPMKKEYKVNNIFDEAGITFNEIVSTFLISFLDKEFNNFENNDIMNNDIISNL